VLAKGEDGKFKTKFEMLGSGGGAGGSI